MKGFSQKPHSAAGVKEKSPTPGGGPARVVFLLEDLLYGGTQRQALELARRLDKSRLRGGTLGVAPGRRPPAGGP